MENKKNLIKDILKGIYKLNKSPIKELNENQIRILTELNNMRTEMEKISYLKGIKEGIFILTNQLKIKNNQSKKARGKN